MTESAYWTIWSLNEKVGKRRRSLLVLAGAVQLACSVDRHAELLGDQLQAFGCLPVVRPVGTTGLGLVLDHLDEVGWVASNYLRVPDTGGLAIPAMSGSMRRVAEYRSQESHSARTLIVATTTSRRAAAWTRLLEEIAAAHASAAFSAEVMLWDELCGTARFVRGSTFISVPWGLRKPVWAAR